MSWLSYVSKNVDFLYLISREVIRDGISGTTRLLIEKSQDQDQPGSGSGPGPDNAAAQRAAAADGPGPDPDPDPGPGPEIFQLSGRP